MPGSRCCVAVGSAMPFIVACHLTARADTPLICARAMPVSWPDVAGVLACSGAGVQRCRLHDRDRQCGGADVVGRDRGRARLAELWYGGDVVAAGDISGTRDRQAAGATVASL